MSFLNPFAGSGFDVISMTMAINRIPDVARYIGFLERMGIFTPYPITTVNFAAEEYAEKLNLLVSQPRGGVAPKNETGKAKLRDFRVPHFPLEDVIKPDEIQGVRAFGTENQVTTAEAVMSKKLAQIRKKHDLTKEWMRMHCLKGIVLDGDGSTLLNLFQEFQITAPSVIDFALQDNATDVNAKVRSVINYIEDNLLGDVYTGILGLCSRTFYDAFIGHPTVREAYTYFSTPQPLSADVSKNFTFAGVTFIPFNANTTSPDGTVRKFVTDHSVHFIPQGTQNTFVEVNAPADFMETVNTPGLPFYAKQEPMKYNRGIEVHTQMNYLPFCARPELLIRGKRNTADA